MLNKGLGKEFDQNEFRLQILDEVISFAKSAKEISLHDVLKENHFPQ